MSSTRKDNPNFDRSQNQFLSLANRQACRALQRNNLVDRFLPSVLQRQSNVASFLSGLPPEPLCLRGFPVHTNKLGFQSTFWILSRHSMNTPRATFLMLPGRCAQFQGICASLHLRLLCKQAMRVKLGKSSKNSPKACARWKLVSSNDHLEGSGATTNADCPVRGKGVSLLRWPLFGCSKG